MNVPEGVNKVSSSGLETSENSKSFHLFLFSDFGKEYFYQLKFIKCNNMKHIF